MLSQHISYFFNPLIYYFFILVIPMSELNRYELLIQEFIESQEIKNGLLLPLLHFIQDKVGYVPSESVPNIAKAVNISRAEVHGVISYYHFFKTQPGGKHVLQICRAEACQACGSEELLTLAQEKLGCMSHQTSKNGVVSLESVYCLGLCATSPAIQIDERLYARVSTIQLEKLLTQLESTS
jgi:formate dehydrogenase subunit gamma